MDAAGFSGGIWMFWRSNQVTVTAFEEHSQHLTVKISKLGETPWLFSAIYASPDSGRRRELWRKLEEVKDNFNGPWLLAGDFNETMSIEERNGANGSEMQRRCRAFSDWVNSNGLLDLGSSGPDHTWFVGDSQETFKSAKLDRGLANDSWRLRFEEAAVRVLPKVSSDHCPILISTNGFAPIPRVLKPFRFQAAWLSQESFEEFILSNWSQEAPLVPFLKEFAKKLNLWSKEKFYNIFRKKSELWARLEGIQRTLAAGGPRYLLKLEKTLKKEMEVVLKQEETLWFQKSRMEALKDGDCNTRYFHLSTVIRRKQNRIETLQDGNGVWVTDGEEIKAMVLEFWSNMFREENSNGPQQKLLNDYFPRLSGEEWNAFNRPFANCEVKAALMDMKPYKAPGPDGFQPIFYQRFWEVVSPNLIKLVKDVLESRQFPEGLNDAFIVLIPKCDAPQRVSHFRPIGLCNIVYKVVTKVLLNRLKPVLPSLISPTQCSFVPCRQITDNVIIVQEMLHTMRRKQGRMGYMAVKIDFEKAYDRLRWSFIRDSLIELRLPLHMVELVMWCITSARLQILWNGVPTEFFSPTRGIRQGPVISISLCDLYGKINSLDRS